jgi:rubrerythrin
MREEINKVLEMIPQTERDFVQQIAGKDERHNRFVENMLEKVMDKNKERLLEHQNKVMDFLKEE